MVRYTEERITWPPRGLLYGPGWRGWLNGHKIATVWPCYYGVSRPYIDMYSEGDHARIYVEKAHDARTERAARDLCAAGFFVGRALRVLASATG